MPTSHVWNVIRNLYNRELNVFVWVIDKFPMEFIELEHYEVGQLMGGN